MTLLIRSESWSKCLQSYGGSLMSSVRKTVKSEQVRQRIRKPFKNSNSKGSSKWTHVSGSLSFLIQYLCLEKKSSILSASAVDLQKA